MVAVTGITSDILITRKFQNKSAIFTLPGDSGGPLLVQNDAGVEELVGVVSMSDHQNKSFFTNAVTYQEWIKGQ
jgi:secreted trypsin-like serine protease